MINKISHLWVFHVSFSSFRNFNTQLPLVLNSLVCQYSERTTFFSSFWLHIRQTQCGSDSGLHKYHSVLFSKYNLTGKFRFAVH